MGVVMYAFIWESTSPISTNWHDGGGLVVVAPSVERAREIWELRWTEIRQGCYSPDRVVKRSGAADGEPDHAWPLKDGAETVIVFEDAGCC